MNIVSGAAGGGEAADKCLGLSPVGAVTGRGEEQSGPGGERRLPGSAAPAGRLPPSAAAGEARADLASPSF